MIKVLYKRIHDFISRPGERGESSGGYLPFKIRAAVVAICSSRAGRLLEVGCGEGILLHRLCLSNSKLDVIGIDINESLLAKARERFAIKKDRCPILVMANAKRLPIKDNLFDTVLIVNVVLLQREISNVRSMLLELARVCKRGGRIIIDYRNSRNMLFHLLYKHAHLYDATLRSIYTCNISEIRKICDEAGLKIIGTMGVGFFVKSLAPVVILELEKL
ncbi:MAG: class I SAM-dependent methyltransferase [Candidatus Omnitrophica bacterium]|nr:class I SAM-dependent methyltransferase [Candidatus Omnitrophota bacterium]